MMSKLATAAAATLLLPMAAAETVPLVTFDGADGTVSLESWSVLVDPVMGGESTGTWATNETDAFGILDGEVVDVPSLSAPGFVTAGGIAKYPDATAAADGELVLVVRSSTADYTGYRVSLAAGALSPSYSCASGGALPMSGGCYKADFSVPASDDFVEVRIPFSSFSDHWSSATGDQTTTCSEDPSVCPRNLDNIQYVQVWAEGVNGKIHLEVQSISAVSADEMQSVSKHTKSVKAIAPLDTVDATAYIGRWYQPYASLTVKAVTELGGNCVTADYGVVEGQEGVISVTNTVRLASRLPVGIDGYAVQSPTTQGDFQVFLGPSADPNNPEPYTKSNYWIIGLGPINDDGLYDWATVSEKTQETLYVLCRDVATFKEKYEADVLAELEEQGFTTFLNRPRVTNQDGCKY